MFCIRRLLCRLLTSVACQRDGVYPKLTSVRVRRLNDMPHTVNSCSLTKLDAKYTAKQNYLHMTYHSRHESTLLL